MTHCGKLGPALPKSRCEGSRIVPSNQNRGQACIPSGRFLTTEAPRHRQQFITRTRHSSLVTALGARPPVGEIDVTVRPLQCLVIILIYCVKHILREPVGHLQLNRSIKLESRVSSCSNPLHYRVTIQFSESYESGSIIGIEDERLARVVTHNQTLAYG